MDVRIGEYYKHFKGKDLYEKNIYQILALDVIYTGVNSKNELDNLVVYKNVFNDKIFVREYDDLFSPVNKEQQDKYGQVNRIEKLTDEEIEIILSEEFRNKKLEYMNVRK